MSDGKDNSKFEVMVIVTIRKIQFAVHEQVQKCMAIVAQKRAECVKRNKRIIEEIPSEN